jgi:hypothetical protein
MRRDYAHPDRYDPWRRLLAAITLQAVWDVHQPPRRLSEQDRYSALAFLVDRQVKGMLDDAGVSVPWPQVKKLVERHLA